MTPIRQFLSLALAFYACALAAIAQSPDVQAALADREAHYQPADWPHIFYATLRPHVGDDATNVERALKLTIASTSTQPILQRCKPTHIGGGVFRLDLRDLRWSTADWFTVAAKRNPYSLGVLPLVVRADWLVQEISDQHESDSYLRLLFGDKLPKTIDDVRSFFQVNNDVSLRFGMIVGDSGVNKQGVRWMESRPIARGYYWQTFDALQLDARRDPIEHPDGTFDFDGSEIIIGMPKLWLGDKTRPGRWGVLQSYFLTDGKNNIVARAPVDLVEDSTGFRGLREIRNPGSCIQCHADGLNVPAKNEFRSLLLSGVDLYAKQKEREQLERFHLSGLTDEFNRANDDFQFTVTMACDCKPVEAVAGFKASVLRYDAPLNLEQTASELGVEVAQWSKQLTTNPTLPARLASLAHGGTIPRVAWEESYLAAYRSVYGGEALPVQVEVPAAKAVETPKPAAKPAPVQQRQPQRQQQFNNRRFR